MNEAQQIHDNLLNTLLLIVPRPVYQDIRRLNNLVWAVTGLFGLIPLLTQHLPLPHVEQLSLPLEKVELSQIRSFAATQHDEAGHC